MRKLILLLCLSRAWAGVTITLPVEVVGLDGSTTATSVTIPNGTDVSGTMQLRMQVNGIKYETEASVQFNGSSFIAINTANSIISGLDAAYGGIGGGHTTLNILINIPSTTMVANATNTITWKFVATNGITSGYRVITFQVLDHTGTPVINSGDFVNDDPSTWKPPLNNGTDIAAGLSAFQTATLHTVTSDGTGGTAMVTHCGDCHAQDGRDLKYFNYSNNSIEIRSQAHGLTPTQGQQIASYIRSLTTPSPGRVWNPPYQPGPGIDSGSAANWAAGAGLSMALSTDYAMYPYLAPSGSTAGWAATGNINAREIPIAFQLPDWNSWLPIIHPKDKWGAAFTGSQLNTNYAAIRAGLIAGNAASYAAQSGNLWQFQQYENNFLSQFVKGGSDPAWNTASYTESIYSTVLWSMTKLWEINQEFQLEGMPSAVFGSSPPNGPDHFEWYSHMPFFTSPNMITIPTTAVGIGVHNTLGVTATYTRMEWYWLQLILNQRDNTGSFNANTPNDFGYIFNHLQTLGFDGAGASPQGAEMLEWLIKGLQDSNMNGLDPSYGSAGWQPIATDLSRAVVDSFISGTYNAWSSGDRIAALTGFLQAWADKGTNFTAAEYYAGGWASSSDIPNANYPANSFANAVRFTIPIALYYGVNGTWGSQMTTWAQTVWPLFTWSTLLDATCHNGTLNIVCVPGTGGPRVPASVGNGVIFRRSAITHFLP